jgi:hypothetical protein
LLCICIDLVTLLVCYGICMDPQGFVWNLQWVCMDLQ